MQHKILKKILEFKKEKEKRKKRTRWESTPKVAWNTKPVEEIPTEFFLIKPSITILLNNYIKVNKIKSLN